MSKSADIRSRFGVSSSSRRDEEMQRLERLLKAAIDGHKPYIALAALNQVAGELIRDRSPREMRTKHLDASASHQKRIAIGDA